MTRTEEPTPGRHLDVRGDGPVVVLWHGRGADSRGVLDGLSELIAAHGRTVVTPDWDAGHADGGRADLLTSVRRAREIATEQGQDPDTIVVAGWSLGGVAAVSLALNARRLGIGVGGLVLIAPADGPRATDPITGQPLPTELPPGAGRCHVDVVYGDDDTITPPDMVCGLELRLRAAGWSTSLHEIAADHGEVVGATYDERRDAFVPARSQRAADGARTVAAIVAAASPSS
ncbi:alpha/beta hydrolase [Aeromicrobium chenweiae]|uniref:Esterase n=1 Tax=Aeromicrobium chenweiae TaxID=2079793 RepID=A0A2S0WRR0_9ACTN|nr:alpha/beta hydrolase [Aeromicrobium chenweiae]AWB93924.1 esterase [Aeromicrobium chenweiae]TGN30969.1 alpha/beta hydrolase [Aeromicrobium chenweiae]